MLVYLHCNFPVYCFFLYLSSILFFSYTFLLLQYVVWILLTCECCVLFSCFDIKTRKKVLWALLSLSSCLMLIPWNKNIGNKNIWNKKYIVLSYTFLVYGLTCVVCYIVRHFCLYLFLGSGLIGLLMEPGKLDGSSGTRTLSDNLSDLRAQVAANQKVNHQLSVATEIHE